MKKIIALFLLIFLVGCEEPQYHVRHLPAQPREVPGANIPRALRVRNWRGSLGEGSCVHATTKNVLVWLGDFQGAANWKYENGEFGSELCRKLKEKGYEYISSNNANHRYLEWASEMRLPAIIWWKPSHCCMFAGFAKGSEILAWNPRAKGINPALEYAMILDNNHIEEYEYEEKSRFLRLWLGYGGFCAIILKDPTTSYPYISYELD